MSARVLLPTALLVLASLASPVTAQTNACSLTPKEARGVSSNALRELVGQTGFSEQRGLGGTGVSARTQERGLGGTGIIGIVTGFGSVCVNGFEVEVDRNSNVTLEGISARRADVQLGQLVEIEAYPRNGHLIATQVKIRVQVVGPIESIAPDGRELRVAGQKVRVSTLGRAGVPRMIKSDWVAVSGLRQEDGSILGTSIARLQGRGRRVVVSGRLEQSSGGALRLGELTIEGPNLQAGQFVTLRGDLDGGVMDVRDSRLESATPFSTGVRILSVQADAPLLEAELSRASGALVRLDANDYRQVAGAGAPVQADGQVRIGSSFSTDKIKVPELSAILSSRSQPPVLAPRPGGGGRDAGRDPRLDQTSPRPDPDSSRPDRSPLGRPDIGRMDRPARPDSRPATPGGPGR